MRKLLQSIFLLAFLLFVSTELSAQSGNNFERLQELSLDKIKTHKKHADLINQQEYSSDSIFKAFDVDIDLTLGEISFEVNWGDPVKNPRIRGNRASNLFGPVRHNADGSVRWHRGFDYYAPKGTPVFSVGSGVVSLVQKHPDFGLCVLITHKRPHKVYYSFYAHLSAISVRYGERVEKGTQLGKSGTSGNAYNLTGEDEHLHFEYRMSPKHGDRKQANPNAIVKTKFYSASPKDRYQSNVKVVKKDFNFIL